jgi:hypothetical protein
MRYYKIKNRFLPLALILMLCSMTSCLTSRKLDKYVAKHYNNELPKLSRKKTDIIVSSIAPASGEAISTTVHKTNRFLPLIVYWQYKHAHNCSLNSSIPVTSFTNTVNSLATKSLAQKLNGQQLELTVEQAPANFSMVQNEHMVWVIYAFSWAKVYIEPDGKDLVVSYKLKQANQILKTGTITVQNTSKNQGLRFFQSWKSATNEYLTNYNANLTVMAKSFVNQLTKEL